MPEKSVRVFCVHSKRRPIQNQFYEALHDSFQGLGITLTHYDEWSWLSPGGKTDADVEREKRRKSELHRQGYSNLNGLGWIQNAPVDLKRVLQKPDYPEQHAFNEGDLSRLLSDSHCLILLEDEFQANLSEGVHAELALLRKLDKRILNVRLCNRREDAYERTIYPFAPEQFFNGVLGIGVSPEGVIPPEDIELITFVIALWCADEAGHQARPKRGGPSHGPDFNRCPVGSDAGSLYRHKTAIRLATTPQDHLRYAALLHMSAARSESLRDSICCWLVNLFRHDGPWRRHLADFLRFTEFLPDIDWTAVTDEIRRAPRPSHDMLVGGASLVSGMALISHLPLFGGDKDPEKSALEPELLARLRSLPRWAVVSFAARVARDSWPLYAWRRMSRRQAEQLEETLRLAESAATAERLEAREIVSRSSVDMCRERLGALAGIAVAAAAYMSAADAHETAGRRQQAEKLDGQARDLVAKITLNCFSAAGVRQMFPKMDELAATWKSRGTPATVKTDAGKKWWQIWR